MEQDVEDSVDDLLQFLKSEIDNIASDEAIEIKAAFECENIYIENLSGEEFEAFCAHELIKNGWDAQLTNSSGDQGIDIYGQINGVIVIFQCKRYNHPVGNGAVQEAIAAKNFAKAHIAAVITNNVFTKSACQLAEATNVYLLHHTQIENFTELFIS